jgi:hypothetical protein
MNVQMPIPFGHGSRSVEKEAETDRIAEYKEVEKIPVCGTVANPINGKSSRNSAIE